MLDLKGLGLLALRYACERPHDDPRLAPVSSSFAGLPPIAVFASTKELHG